jgi:putative transposase
LRKEGVNIGRKKAGRLMGLLGLSAIYSRPRLSEPLPGHKIYPYLLRGVAVTRVNQAWSADITYIRLKGGFVYLAAVMDWRSSFVLSRRLSTALYAAFCVDTLEEALGRYGPRRFSTPTRGASLPAPSSPPRLKNAE